MALTQRIKMWHPDTGDEEWVEMPANWEVCPRCNGEGVHDPEGFRDGFTQNEMAEMGPDFAERYAAGKYDVKCTVCQGRTTVPVVDRSQCTPEQEEVFQYDEEVREELAYMEAAILAERMMGA